MVASLRVRFIRSTWPLVQGCCFGLVRRWSMSPLTQSGGRVCRRKAMMIASSAIESMGRPGHLGAGRDVGDRGPAFPLGHGLPVDPVALGQNSQALLTMCIARRTASVVVALPWRTWPVVPPSTQLKRSHLQTPDQTANTACHSEASRSDEPGMTGQPRPTPVKNARTASAQAAGFSSCSRWPVPGIAR